MTVEGPDGPRQFALPNTSPINVYNALSAVALLAEFGLAKDRIAQCMDQLTIVESRFSKVELKGRGLVLHLAQGAEPHRLFPGLRQRAAGPGEKDGAPAAGRRPRRRPLRGEHRLALRHGL